MTVSSTENYNQTVLLIDDQITALVINEAVLKSLELNLNIVTMSDPVKAMEWIKDKHVDLVITDFRMKTMDGMDVITAVKKTNKSANPIPVIVITVLKDTSLHTDLLDAGAVACLTKPISSKILAETAAKALNQG